MTMLQMFTIYDRPADHPNHVVLVSRGVREDGAIIFLGSALADTLEEARAVPMSYGCTCIGRDPLDDASVVESWL